MIDNNPLVYSLTTKYKGFSFVILTLFLQNMSIQVFVFVHGNQPVINGLLVANIYLCWMNE